MTWSFDTSLEHPEIIDFICGSQTNLKEFHEGYLRVAKETTFCYDKVCDGRKYVAIRMHDNENMTSQTVMKDVY